MTGRLGHVGVCTIVLLIMLSAQYRQMLLSKFVSELKEHCSGHRNCTTLVKTYIFKSRQTMGFDFYGEVKTVFATMHITLEQPLSNF